MPLFALPPFVAQLTEYPFSGRGASETLMCATPAFSSTVTLFASTRVCTSPSTMMVTKRDCTLGISTRIRAGSAMFPCGNESGTIFVVSPGANTTTPCSVVAPLVCHTTGIGSEVAPLSVSASWIALPAITTVRRSGPTTSTTGGGSSSCTTTTNSVPSPSVAETGSDNLTSNSAYEDQTMSSISGMSMVARSCPDANVTTPLDGTKRVPDEPSRSIV